MRQPLAVSDLPVYRPTLLPICACLLCLHVHPSPNLLPSHLLCLPPCPSFPARIPALSFPPLLTMEAYTGLVVTLPRHPQGPLQLVLSALLPAFPPSPLPRWAQSHPSGTRPGCPYHHAARLAQGSSASIPARRLAWPAPLLNLPGLPVLPGYS